MDICRPTRSLTPLLATCGLTCGLTCGPTRGLTREHTW